MALQRKIEQISFYDGSTYLDITVCEGYIEMTTNDNDKISLDLKDWNQVDKEVRKIFKDMRKDERVERAG